MKQPYGRKPRFNVGERVRIVGPAAGSREQGIGTVSEIIGAGADTVLRYRVEFPDGDSRTFFGFELEMIES